MLPLEGRSKESITLDLKTPTGREVHDRLLARADVFGQYLASGASGRMGLDSAFCATRWPRLIVCDISGYGASGLDRAAIGHSGLTAASLPIEGRQ